MTITKRDRSIAASFVVRFADCEGTIMRPLLKEHKRELMKEAA